MSEEWISGKNPVLEAMRSGRSINKIWVAEGASKGQMKQVYQLAKENGIIIQQAPRKKLDELSNSQHHQGVVASVAAYQYANIEDMLEAAARKKEDPFIILLDEIADPHNLGSILRTADAAGVHGVIIPKRRAVGLTQTVAKASTGAIEHVPVARVTNIARTMDELKKQGLWFVGTDASADDDFRSWSADMPIGLVIGSEGKGVSRLVKEKCDILLNIPMVGKVTSLNASVAASLLMYEVYRKRHPLGSE
ncbi:23S rRNA (guanosine(2251)-2'-O)-methyltransferase RlmB [Alteribacillus iranensis]|uniref:23S rRNA (Guanosine2251-2'-O)-methyltransferase n=1 Tax=Alteribacillus iranensis TaxID=930128 RepID=A0A1I2F7L3_9BACI|nr:23S rRNA (guanosine(2251)-2'-O)-methyltransferase RlmB [Alteribacillus iranensis]SFF01023.1 23S rRNA (guanosine2251-2'-O)-methyltransferase [Alteribacillus iranensis]